MYEKLGEDSGPDVRREVKKLYFDFLEDFRTYLVDFVREASVDLTISDIKVNPEPQKLFFGEYGGMHVVLKNQGRNSCYISTDKRGAYRLDPDEKERFWLNKETTVVTVSGNTTVGFIRT